MKRYISLFMAVLSVLAMADAGFAQLRIVNYNTANGTFPSGNDYLPRTGMDLVLQAIGDEVTNGISRPIDVLILQEQDDPSTTTQAFVELLDDLYGEGTYAHSTVITLPTYSDNIRQTLIYNTNTVELIHEKAFGTTGSNYAARQSARFQLRPVGYDSSADFYIYNDHYKSSTGTDNEDRRDYEATFVRADADALGQGASIIYAGDFNMYSSNEPAYQTLLSSGNGQAFDPINTPGNWNNNYTYRAVHTQSPHDGSDGLVTGGMDDRFDFQLVTGELLDNEGMSYIAGSYHAFGNNGTTYNQPVNYWSNTYPVSQSVLDALAHVSDHLPVVVDYQLPAKMGIEVSSIPSAVIVNSTLDIDITVSNVAPVQTTNGADELDYTVYTSGDITGSGSGIAYALQAGNVHTVSFDTSTAGSVSGGLAALSTSQSVADGILGQTVNVDVLDHAEASFASGTDQDLLTIDFGSVSIGDVAEVGFDIFNLQQTLGYTADLDLDAILGSVDTDVLTTNLGSFAGLAAGSPNSFIASFDTSTAGSYSATYTITLSDEDILGEASQQLSLQLIGTVLSSAIEGDLNGDGYVGLDDLDIVLNAWNQSVTPGDADGDPSGDGFVGLDDLDIVLNNWNNGTPPSANVPEPAAATLLSLAGLALMNQRKRR